MFTQVIWDSTDGTPLCGVPISAAAVAFFNEDPERLVSCGHDCSVSVWQLEKAARKLNRVAIQLGQQYRRNFTTVAISADDSRFFLGSSSGDVAEV